MAHPRFIALILIGISVLSVSAQEPQAASIQAELIERTPPEFRRVRWEGPGFQIAKNREGQLVAVVKGAVQRDWHLVWNSKHLPMKGGRFQTVVPLTSERTELDFVAVGPRGETALQRIQLHLAQYEALAQKSPSQTKALNSPSSSFVPGVGLTYLSYTETEFEKLSGFTVTGKASYRLPISTTRWDLGFTGYLNILPLSASTGEGLRFLGLNFRAGYTFPLDQGWSVGVHTGWYYTTTIVSNQAFGFAHMQGTQLFPTLRKALSGGRSVSGYFKLSPVSDGISLPLSLRNREMAIGAAYGMVLSSGTPVALTLDLAALDLDHRGIQMKSRSATLGFSLSL